MMVKGSRDNCFYCRRASTLVEFAMVLPLLAMLLFGIIQWGFIIAAQITLRNATAVGARYATLQTNPLPTQQQIVSVTQAAAAPMLKSDQVVVAVNTDATVGGVGGAKSVQATYSLPLIIPFVVAQNLPKSVTLSATTIMR